MILLRGFSTKRMQCSRIPTNEEHMIGSYLTKIFLRCVGHRRWMFPTGWYVLIATGLAFLTSVLCVSFAAGRDTLCQSRGQVPMRSSVLNATGLAWVRYFLGTICPAEFATAPDGFEEEKCKNPILKTGLGFLCAFYHLRAEARPRWDSW